MLIVYLPFVLRRDEDGAVTERLTHVHSSKRAKQIAEAAAQGSRHFGFDKVQYLGLRLGEHQYGPRLARWSTMGRL